MSDPDGAGGGGGRLDGSQTMRATSRWLRMWLRERRFASSSEHDDGDGLQDLIEEPEEEPSDVGGAMNVAYRSSSSSAATTPCITNTNGEQQEGTNGATYGDDDSLEYESSSAMPRASLVQRLLFNWFDSFVGKGRDAMLTSEEIPGLHEEYRAHCLSDLWFLEAKYLKPGTWIKNETLRLVLKIGKPNLIASGILEVVRIVFSLLVPLALQRLIVYIEIDEDKDGLPTHGLLYGFFLVAMGFLGSLSETHSFFQLNMTGMKAKSALTAAIFRKCMALKQPKDSDVVNMISVDIFFVQKALRFVHLPWVCPLQLLVSVCFLFSILGISILPGMLGLMFILLFSVIITYRMRSSQQEQLERKDKRLQKIVEVLNHLKVIKFHVWEESFEDQVNQLRGTELDAMKNFLRLQAFQSFLWNCAIFLVAFLSFTTYSLLDTSSDRLTSEAAFVSLAIFNNMRSIFRMVPSCITSFSQGSVSIKRIDAFLNQKELALSYTRKHSSKTNGTAAHGTTNGTTTSSGNGSAAPANGIDPESKHAIVMRACSFSRGIDDSEANGDPTSFPLCLENVSCCVSRGELVGVIGHMGSGKSTLIEAMAGELHKMNGTIEVNDRVTLVANNPWLKSGTIKENILFGNKLVQAQYDRIIKACGLLEDFRLFPHGDATWVHGSGENLSGGQRQRISLARALYKNSPTYVLDDPLSAVDPKLRQSIFKEVIGRDGLMRKKTRILIVNEYSLIASMDKIILMHERCIADVGTARDLAMRHNLDAEVAWPEKRQREESVDEEIPEEFSELNSMSGESMSRRASQKAKGSLRKRPALRRQETTKEVLHAMKTITYDNAEDMAFESVTVDNYMFYAQNLGYFASLFVLTGYISSQAFEVLSKLWLAEWTSKKDVDDHRSENDFIKVYGLLGLLQALSFLIAVLQTNAKTIQASSRIHKTIFQKVIFCTLEFVWANQVGAIANRFSKDMNEVDLNLPSTLKSFLFQAARILGTLFLVLFTFPGNAFAVMPLLFATFLVFRAYIRISRLFRRLSSATMASLNSYVTENVNGAATIRTYKTQGFSMEQCMHEIDGTQKHFFMEMASDCWLFVRLQIITGLFIAALATIIVLYRHSITSHMAGLCLTSAIMIMSDIFLFTRYAAALEKSMVSVERLQEYTEIVQEDVTQTSSDPLLAPLPPFTYPRKKSTKEIGQISFAKLTARYPLRGDLCVKDVSFSIKPGEKVGVVGRTGAGKSSVVLLLYRMIERLEGSLLVDDVDIAKVDLTKHRARMTIIPQNPALFHGTLRFNLDPRGRHSDASLIDTFRQSGLTDFLNQLPGGLDYLLDSDGMGLSVGERQMICCLRALLNDTKIVILDEATSSLNPSAENKMLSCFNEHFKNATVLSITHRVQKVLHMDKVLVLQAGTVKEFESPSRLMQDKNSLFYSMLRESKSTTMGCYRKPLGSK